LEEKIIKKKEIESLEDRELELLKIYNNDLLILIDSGGNLHSIEKQASSIIEEIESEKKRRLFKKK
jgi:hypothetical protein